MKFLKILFITLVVLIVVAGLGLFIFLKNLDINRYKSKITDQISQVIHRPVEIGSLALDISFKQGLQLTIERLTVKDNDQNLIEVGSADLHINPVVLLTTHQVYISEVGLNDIVVNLLRDQQGVINLQKIITEINSSPTGGTSPSAPQSAAPAHPQNILPNLLISTISINNGVVKFVDKTVDPALKVRVEKIDLEVSNLSLNKPFSYELAFGLLSDKQNVKLSGLAQLDLNNNQVQVRNLQVSTQLSDISLKQVMEYVPSLKDSGLESLEGELTFGAKQMKIGPAGLLGMLSTTVLNGGKIKIQQLQKPFENIHLLINIGDRDMTIQDFSVGLNSGKIEVLGQISDYLKSRIGRLSMTIDGISISGLFPEGQIPCEVEGRLYGKYDILGQWGEPRTAVISSTGNGSFELKEGKLSNVNILRVALEKISVIPNLVETIEANLPEQWKQVLTKQETILEKVSFETKIDKGTLFINKADVKAEGLYVTAVGDLDYNQNLSLNADLYIDPELSSAIIASVSQLAALRDETGQIHIPFKPYHGKLAQLQMFPNVADLGKSILMDQGKEELKKAIFKALDIEPTPAQDTNTPESQTTAPSDGSSSQQPPSKKEPRPEEVIINDILNKVFK